MKVPEYQQSIDPITPRVPISNQPNPPVDAFGGNVARANQSIAKVGLDIGQALLKRQVEKKQFEQDQIESNSYNQYQVDKQNALFNEEPEEISVNGVKSSRPKGFLNRRLGQTNGLTSDFGKWSNEYAGSVLGKIQDPNTRAKLGKRIAADVISTRDNIMKHEMDEYKKDKIASFSSGIDVAKNNAFTSRTDKELNVYINDALVEQDKLNNFQGVDDKTAQGNFKKIFGDIIENAVAGNLEYDKTGNSSRAIIDKYKDSIEKGKASDLVKMVDNQMKVYSKETEEQLNDKFLADTLSPADIAVASIPAEEGGIGSKKAAALQKQLEQAQNTRLTEIKKTDQKAEGYINLVNLMFDDKTDNFNAKQLLVEAYSDGYLSKGEKDHLKKVQESILKIKSSKEFNESKGVVRALGSFFHQNDPSIEKQSDALKRLIGSVSNGEDPTKSGYDIAREEYNKLYPERPLTKDEDPFNVEKEKEAIFVPAVTRIAKGVATGAIGSVEAFGGSLQWLGAKKVGKWVEDRSKVALEAYKVEYPNFGDKALAGLGSTLTFFLPGLGIAKGVKLASALPRLAVWLGVGSSSLMEATAESGSTYLESIERGMPEKQASNNAAKTFWLNLPTLVITNKLGLFGEDGKYFMRALKSSGSEGFQEFTQQLISNIALKDPAFQGSLESAMIGAIVGGGLKLADTSTNVLKELKETSEIQEDNNKKNLEFIDNVDKVINKEDHNVAKDENGKPIEINSEAPVKQKGEAGVNKEKPSFIKDKYDNPNDPKMLDYLGQYLSPKIIAEMSPNARLLLGNMQAAKLRDVVDSFNSDERQKSFLEDIKKKLEDKKGQIDFGGNKEIEKGKSKEIPEVTFENKPNSLNIKNIKNNEGVVVGDIVYDTETNNPSIITDEGLDISINTQRKGYGTAAIKKVFDSGINVIKGDVSKTNPGAIKFWEAIGGKLTKTESGNYKLFLNKDNFIGTSKTNLSNQKGQADFGKESSKQEELKSLVAQRNTDNYNKDKSYKKLVEDKISKLISDKSGSVLLPSVDPKVKKDFFKFIDSAFIPLSTRLGKIDASLKDTLRKFEFNKNINTQSDLRIAEPFLYKMSDLKEEDFNALDLALKNGEIETVNKIVKENGIEKEYASVRSLLDNLYAKAKEVGIDVGYIDDYFPRRVNDPEAYLNYLNKGENWSEINKAVRNEEKRLEHLLTEDEKVEFINKLLRGYGSDKINVTKPSNVKNRKIQTINEEMNSFYKPSTGVLVDYITAMNNAIEGRKFFGINGKDIDQSIGAYTKDLVDRGIINAAQEREVKVIVEARFKARGAHGIWQLYKNLGYIYTMGSPISAVTQIGDLAFALYDNGVYSTAKGIGKAFSKNKITKEDIGIELIADEFTDKSKSSKAVTTVFKLIGLEKMDRIGKETLINGAMDRLSKKAKANDPALIKELDRVFGSEADQVLKDLKNQEPSHNVKYMLFSELSDFQPISVSEMPEFYAKGGNLRVFYMLKSYSIKQIDAFNNEVFMKMKTDPKQAMKNLLRLSFALMLLNASADTIKDLLLGRTTKLSDLVVDNIMRLMGLSKYTIYKARIDGVGEAITKTILPPIPFIDDLTKDLGKDKAIKDLKIWNALPVVGKFYYWWFGGGREYLNKKNNKGQLY